MFLKGLFEILYMMSWKESAKPAEQKAFQSSCIQSARIVELINSLLRWKTGSLIKFNQMCKKNAQACTLYADLSTEAV